MKKTRMRYNILLVDDDYEMNIRLSNLLSGHQIEIGDMVIVPYIEIVNVELIPNCEDKEKWKFSDKTLESLNTLTKNNRYDLLIVDYGYTTDEAKDILWGKDRSRVPSKEETVGRLFTIRDLRLAYETWVYTRYPKLNNYNNIFVSTRIVIFRSFASKLVYDIAGPVYPDRVKQTQAAFSNADIVVFDPRSEIYGGDAYYSFYEAKDGREFYRSLVGAYTLKLVEIEMYKFVFSMIKRINLRRSIFNIAAFGGMIAVVGEATQFIYGIGKDMINLGQATGWYFIISSIIWLLMGTIVLALSFERFSRSVIGWISPEREDD